jgi:ATP-binding cassette, subfamily B, multidrug efflux pump
VAGLVVIGSACGVVMNTATVLPAALLGHALDVALAAASNRATGSDVAWAALGVIGGTAATELPRIGKR